NHCPGHDAGHRKRFRRAGAAIVPDRDGGARGFAERDRAELLDVQRRARGGEGWCFLLNGVSYFAVIAGLFMMRIKKTTQVHDGAAPLEKLREGFRFARHTKPIRALLVLVAIVSFMALPYTVLMPIFAVQILHGGASVYGLLMGAVGAG